MSSRFFVNPFEDYNPAKYGAGITESINKETALDLVKDYVTKILAESKKSTYKLRDDLYVGDAGNAPYKFILVFQFSAHRYCVYVLEIEPIE